MGSSTTSACHNSTQRANINKLTKQLVDNSRRLQSLKGQQHTIEDKIREASQFEAGILGELGNPGFPIVYDNHVIYKGNDGTIKVKKATVITSKISDRPIINKHNYKVVGCQTTDSAHSFLFAYPRSCNTEPRNFRPASNFFQNLYWTNNKPNGPIYFSQYIDGEGWTPYRVWSHSAKVLR